MAATSNQACPCLGQQVAAVAASNILGFGLWLLNVGVSGAGSGKEPLLVLNFRRHHRMTQSSVPSQVAIHALTKLLLTREPHLNDLIKL